MRELFSGALGLELWLLVEAVRYYIIGAVGLWYQLWHACVDCDVNLEVVSRYKILVESKICFSPNPSFETLLVRPKILR